MALRSSSYEGTYISSATTTQIKYGRGVLRRVTFSKPISGSTVTIYDEVAGTTEIIALITNTADVKPYSLEFDLRFSTGLKVVTSGADFVTIVWE